MLVIVIVAILTAIAIPSFKSVITETRMAGEFNTLLGTLKFARSEASKRGNNVSVCPVAESGCASSSNWTAGWQVVLTGNSTRLNIASGVSRGDTLTSTLQTYPIFTPMGYTFFRGTLSLHDSDNTPSLYRCVVFSSGSWTVKSGAVCP